MLILLAILVIYNYLKLLKKNLDFLFTLCHAPFHGTAAAHPQP